LGAVILILSGIAAAAPAAQQRPALDSLVARAAGYVDEFVNRFSNVVAEERYVQTIRSPRIMPGVRGGAVVSGTSVTAQRALMSDFLLVKTPESDDWLTFRDVFEVDGRAVRDRDQRRYALFLQSGGSPIQRATQIARESARYNLVGSARATNDPLLALALVQLRYQKRFRYTLRNRDTDLGTDVWAVDFEERERPSIIQGRLGRDLVAKGRLWIDRETGRVVKTDLSVTTAEHVVTSFQFDEAFGIAVPVKMEENYAVGANGKGSGTATYGHFRRFAVKTEEKVQ
jgi:hypothetical protein